MRATSYKMVYDKNHVSYKGISEPWSFELLDGKYVSYRSDSYTDEKYAVDQAESILHEIKRAGGIL